MTRPFRRAVQLALLALCLPGAAAAQVTAFVGGRVIDGTGTVIDGGTVVVRDGRIAAVGPAAQVTVPAGASRIDLAGKTVMPGLVNAHGHVAATQGLESNPSFYTRDNVLRQLRTYADYGVTTVYSLGDDQQAGFDVRNEQAQGPPTRARLFVAGPVISGATPEEAAAMADRVAAMKPDLLKIRVDDNLGTAKKMPEAAWRAVLERAKAHGLGLAVHVFYLADAQALADAGAYFIAHSVRDVPVTQRFADTLKQKQACYSPTFTRELSTFAYDSTPAWVADPFFLRGAEPGVAAALQDPARQERFKASPAYALGRRYRTGLEVAQRNLKVLADQGVRIAFGTDTGPPARFQGYFEHIELEMMVQAGLTPMQAIVAGTSQAAACHGNKDVGVIAPGAQADLLVLEGNPLADVRDTRSIDAVYIGGRKLDRR